MPIISRVGSKSVGARLVVAGIYLALTVAGITMIVPFMITVSASLSNDFDYDTFRPLPRYLYYRPDRYVRHMVNCFNRYLKWYEQMECRFEDKPENWTSWREAGHDTENIEKLANPWLEAPMDSPEFARWKHIGADYSQWFDTFPSIETLAPVSNVEAAEFLVEKYESEYRQNHPDSRLWGKQLRRAVLDIIGKRWEIPLKQVYTIDFEESELRLPYYQQSYWHGQDNKYLDFADIKRAYAHHRFTPGIPRKWRAWVKSRWDGDETPTIVDVMRSDDPELKALWREFKADVAPAAPVVPLAMRAIWRSYLESEAARDLAGLATEDKFTVADYNRLAGTNYESMYDTPFPVPEDSGAGIRALWDHFVETRYPVRLTRIEVTPEMTAQYRQFLRDRFKNLKYTNQMLGTNMASWEEFDLAPTPPMGDVGGLRNVWEDFVKGLPADQRILTSSEQHFQEWVLAKYGSLAAINEAYGWEKQRIEEVFPPYDFAYAVTFRQNEYNLTFLPILRNYSFILDFIAGQSRAVFVTFVLISMTVFLTLTVNPMAAYALSRFDIRGKDKILLFMLATMAFPAMVSAIPAYLLMRDLGLLNTFFALVLPSAANGMSIFILKGFFDSLPRELYEAATIDGAKEWQIFTIITLPMMKPILAINSLNAFIMAYNGWQWALIICQDPKMWTLSVWMYQANQWWSQDYPWLVTAGFVVVSIPTLLVFLFCQKIILRGIIVPSMK